MKKRRGFPSESMTRDIFAFRCSLIDLNLKLLVTECQIVVSTKKDVLR